MEDFLRVVVMLTLTGSAAICAVLFAMFLSGLHQDVFGVAYDDSQTEEE